MGYDGDHSPTFAWNSRSVLENPQAAHDKIMEEVHLGRVGGPFKAPPFPNFKVSPLALRQKDDGKQRLLHNLSAPYDFSSVNLCIDDAHTKVTYSSIADATAIIAEMPGCYLAKADIKSAFRLVPIRPSDYHLLGFSFEGNFYFDKCLPMGCRSSCMIFQRVSDALVHVLRERYGIDRIVKYLDDFLFFGKTKEECASCLDFFFELCDRIGCPVAHNKTVGPATNLTFLGYAVDSRTMIVSIPLEKIQAYTVY